MLRVNYRRAMEGEGLARGRVKQKSEAKKKKRVTSVQKACFEGRKEGSKIGKRRSRISFPPFLLHPQTASSRCTACMHTPPRLSTIQSRTLLIAASWRSRLFYTRSVSRTAKFVDAAVYRAFFCDRRNTRDVSIRVLLIPTDTCFFLRLILKIESRGCV